MIEKYIIYKEYRTGLIPVHAYEILSKCNLTGCLFNKGGCILFGESDTTNEFCPMPIHADCPKVIKVLEQRAEEDTE